MKNKLIIGVDESGRGCATGKMFGCAAVIIDKNGIPGGIIDSKQTTHSNRKDIYDKILNNKNILFKTASYTSPNIDKLGLGYCNKQIMVKSVEALIRELFNKNIIKDIRELYIIVDGNMKLYSNEFPNLIFNSIPKADRDYIQVSLASMIAKFCKDIEMEELHKLHPQYNFIKHSGYLTKEHIENIYKYGILEGLYRKTYKPIKEYLNSLN